MTKSIFQLVQDFHDHFQLKANTKPGFLPVDLANGREDFLNEEYDEFCAAVANENIEEALDGLIDIVYVAAGTASLMGFSPAQLEEAFKRVHEANMAKIRVENKSESKRDTTWDVKKPYGWKPPYLKDLCE